MHLSGASMDHQQLCERAARWLHSRFRLRIVLVELRTIRTIEQPDVIGWDNNGWSVLVEAKTSRADFLKDKRKRCRRLAGEGNAARASTAGYGMGQEKWFFAPPGIIRAGELPEGWGLAEICPRGEGTMVRVIVPAKGTVLRLKGQRRGRRRYEISAAELQLLLGAVGKISSGHPEGLYRSLLLEPPSPSSSQGGRGSG